MPNSGELLISFLMAMRGAVLDWAKRFNIIQGVARGLVYLHHDSCLKVLDEKMSPKFSDFGFARIFQGTQNPANTESEGCGNSCAAICPWSMPAMGGIFSEKSHVYSFRVLLLKIIGGRKNTSFSYIYFPKFSLSSTTV
ncbi:hypothetical protein L3X38_029753 [Prunus dulcis]|uniref:S-locus lectin protein kinase family protein n=1 Tax=Prunus dulcis TaxID=3755 RepID=A0AAD4Z2F7_PRUDU|nr:hypothetical protein L3X38_029753 [Prunus dulcis]